MPDTLPPDHEPIEIEDIGSNPAPNETIGEVAERRLTRRAALLGLGGAAAAATLTDQLIAAAEPALAQGAPMTGGPSSLGFQEIPHGMAQRDAVAEGYEMQTVIRWGDPILADAPAFDPMAQTPQSQAGQFGYNNDFLDFKPLPQGSSNAEHGLLVVNHEYTDTQLMFAGIGAGRAGRMRASAEQSRTELLAHGLSVVEIRKQGNSWSYVPNSRYNRRITGETEMRISGPAAGHDLLKTSADATGTRVLGTLNNCAGGNTPWGTIITSEENFNQYFSGAAAKTGTQAEAYSRYGIAEQGTYGWSRFVDRFNLDKEPNEPNRFGWNVEFDPYDPNSVPVKRTAMGRFKHEGATHAINHDGRVVFYQGDDERFDYVYKFVTARPWNPNDRAANRDLLDEGTLYVARFADDGKMTWLPLVHGQGQPGRCADQHPPRRRPVAADADGPARGCRGEPDQWPRLRHADQQHEPHRGAGQPDQPARAQRAWACGRDDPARCRHRPRGSCRDRGKVGDLPAGRQARHRSRRALSPRDEQ
jgi:secreted PhoX family phosphatase